MKQETNYQNSEFFSKIAKLNETKKLSYIPSVIRHAVFSLCKDSVIEIMVEDIVVEALVNEYYSFSLTQRFSSSLVVIVDGFEGFFGDDHPKWTTDPEER